MKRWAAGHNLMPWKNNRTISNEVHMGRFTRECWHQKSTPSTGPGSDWFSNPLGHRWGWWGVERGGGPTVRAVGQISCSKSFSIVLKRASEQSSGERAAIGGVGNVGCHDLRRTAPSCFYSFTNAVVVQWSTTTDEGIGSVNVKRVGFSGPVLQLACLTTVHKTSLRPSKQNSTRKNFCNPNWTFLMDYGCTRVNM